MTAVSRRRFLVCTAVGAGFTLSFAGGLTGSSRAAAATGSDTVLNTWLTIGADESVTVFIGSSEMGQGVFTSLAQLVAEELLVDWSAVRAVEAPADPAFANPVTGAQLTGGSMSIRGYYTGLRTAGAAAREMLRKAAAITFGVPLRKCVAAHGVVRVKGTSDSATYGQLAALAATLPVPQNPPLTDPAKFRIIGRPVHRLDIPDKTRGAAIYGVDVRVAGMQHATVVHAPVLGGTLRSPGSLPSGATALVPLDDAVVVVAATTWDAMQAGRRLTATWNTPSSARDMTSSVISAQAATLMATGTAAVADSAGDPAGALAGAATVLELTYELPYLAHAAMEPLACTASVTADSCEVWAPTQAPGLSAAVAADICGLDPSQVTVHTTMLGGGLGRKFETDFVAHAVHASKAVGTPVKVIWSREQDFGHDQYRPMALLRVRAGLSAAGALAGWEQRIVSPSILFQRGWIGPNDVDSQAVEGAIELPYSLPDRLVEYVRHPAAVPVGFWRSVGNSLNAFAVESAIDELALAANTDPVQFRLALLAGDARSSAVLQTVADRAGWAAGPPPGRARGVAMCRSFGSTVAQIAEVSSPSAGIVKVQRIWCVIDCGQTVNPDTVEAQMQGGIVHGLTAALWGRMTFQRGVASPKNFNGYRMTRMRDMPQIDVHVVSSAAAPGGVGEPGVPPVAAAVANAWARLTGTRVRTLPLM